MFKILIRPLEVNDALTSWRWRNDESIWLLTGSRPDRLISPEIETEWIERVIAEDNSKRFAITVDDKYIGNIQLTNILHASAELHIFIGEREFMGKGISKFALYQLLHYAKEVLKLAKVRLSVNENNAAALRLYRSHSFSIVDVIGQTIEMECHLENLPRPTVSVFTMVYNHEDFIAQTIEGFLMQKCMFNTVMVLGDDFSADKSRAIINSYIERYPGKFIKIFHTQNVGAVRNQDAVFSRCNGKYVAICEGDDYWTDSLKLQKQVDFMNQYPEVSFCFHDSSTYNMQTGTWSKYYKPWNFRDRAIIKDQRRLLRTGAGFFSTPSILFKQTLIDDRREHWSSSTVGDLLIVLSAIKDGEIGYLSDDMCVYREMTQFSWSQNVIDYGRKISSIENILETVNRYLANADTLLQYKTELMVAHFNYELVVFKLKKHADDSLLHRIKIIFDHWQSLSVLQRFKAFIRLASN